MQIHITNEGITCHMHAWESIQITLNYIEEHICEDVSIEELADMAALSLFYYQRLFARLVKCPVREYIKLRRLARASGALKDRRNRIVDVAMEYGFGSHETFTRAFKETYGITPTQYRHKSVSLNNFDKPDLLLNYVMVDEDVPLISDGLVLEMRRTTLGAPIDFIGVEGVFVFHKGKMLGERPGVDMAEVIWHDFSGVRPIVPRMPGGREIGVCYHGGAPDGYTTYFAGAETDAGIEGEDKLNTSELRTGPWTPKSPTITAPFPYPCGYTLCPDICGSMSRPGPNDSALRPGPDDFASRPEPNDSALRPGPDDSQQHMRLKYLRLPAREYVVCAFEAEDSEQLTSTAVGKAMKYTRFWLKKHGLIADGFFPEMYYQNLPNIAYMELWIPFRLRG